MLRPLRRAAAVLGLLLVSVTLSGCIIEGGGYGHGWCWWHPYACH